MKSQVTTKRGDNGFSTALSGESYPKSHPVMECVGSVDELRAHTAMLRLRILEGKPEDSEAVAQFLLWLLHTYFVIGTACSDPQNRHPEYHKGAITAREITRLEAEQTRLEERTPLPHAFVVSASNTLAAQADITCTVARRLERNVVRLMEAVPEFQAGDILVFLNRLSDFLYILARRLEHPRHETVDYKLLDAT